MSRRTTTLVGWCCTLLIITCVIHVTLTEALITRSHHVAAYVIGRPSGLANLSLPEEENGKYSGLRTVEVHEDKVYQLHATTKDFSEEHRMHTGPEILPKDNSASCDQGSSQCTRWSSHVNRPAVGKRLRRAAERQSDTNSDVKQKEGYGVVVRSRKTRRQLPGGDLDAAGQTHSLSYGLLDSSGGGGGGIFVGTGLGGDFGGFGGLGTLTAGLRGGFGAGFGDGVGNTISSSPFLPELSVPVGGQPPLLPLSLSGGGLGSLSLAGGFGGFNSGFLSGSLPQGFGGSLQFNSFGGQGNFGPTDAFAPDVSRQPATNPYHSAFKATFNDPSFSPLPFPKDERLKLLEKEVRRDLDIDDKQLTPEQRTTKAIYESISGIIEKPSGPNSRQNLNGVYPSTPKDKEGPQYEASDTTALRPTQPTFEDHLGGSSTPGSLSFPSGWRPADDAPSPPAVTSFSDTLDRDQQGHSFITHDGFPIDESSKLTPFASHVEEAPQVTSAVPVSQGPDDSKSYPPPLVSSSKSITVLPPPRNFPSFEETRLHEEPQLIFFSEEELTGPPLEEHQVQTSSDDITAANYDGPGDRPTHTHRPPAEDSRDKTPLRFEIRPVPNGRPRLQNPSVREHPLKGVVSRLPPLGIPDSSRRPVKLPSLRRPRPQAPGIQRHKDHHPTPHVESENDDSFIQENYQPILHPVGVSGRGRTSSRPHRPPIITPKPRRPLNRPLLRPRRPSMTLGRPGHRLRGSHTQSTSTTDNRNITVDPVLDLFTGKIPTLRQHRPHPETQNRDQPLISGRKNSKSVLRPLPPPPPYVKLNKPNPQESQYTTTLTTDKEPKIELPKLLSSAEFLSLAELHNSNPKPKLDFDILPTTTGDTGVTPEDSYTRTTQLTTHYKDPLKVSFKKNDNGSPGTTLPEITQPRTPTPSSRSHTVTPFKLQATQTRPRPSQTRSYIPVFGSQSSSSRPNPSRMKSLVFRHQRPTSFRTQPSPPSSSRTQPSPPSSSRTQPSPPSSSRTQPSPPSSSRTQPSPPSSSRTQPSPPSSSRTQPSPPSSSRTQPSPPSSSRTQPSPSSSFRTQPSPPSSSRTQPSPPSSSRTQPSPSSSFRTQPSPPSSSRTQPSPPSSSRTQPSPSSSFRTQPSPPSSSRTQPSPPSSSRTQPSPSSSFRTQPSPPSSSRTQPSPPSSSRTQPSLSTTVKKDILEASKDTAQAGLSISFVSVGNTRVEVLGRGRAQYSSSSCTSPLATKNSAVHPPNPVSHPPLESLNVNDNEKQFKEYKGELSSTTTEIPIKANTFSTTLDNLKENLRSKLPLHPWVQESFGVRKEPRRQELHLPRARGPHINHSSRGYSPLRYGEPFTGKHNGFAPQSDQTQPKRPTPPPSNPLSSQRQQFNGPPPPPPSTSELPSPPNLPSQSSTTKQQNRPLPGEGDSASPIPQTPSSKQLLSIPPRHLPLAPHENTSSSQRSSTLPPSPPPLLHRLEFQPRRPPPPPPSTSPATQRSPSPISRLLIQPRPKSTTTTQRNPAAVHPLVFHPQVSTPATQRSLKSHHQNPSQQTFVGQSQGLQEQPNQQPKFIFPAPHYSLFRQPHQSQQQQPPSHRLPPQQRLQSLRPPPQEARRPPAVSGSSFQRRTNSPSSSLSGAPDQLHSSTGRVQQRTQKISFSMSLKDLAQGGRISGLSQEPSPLPQAQQHSSTSVGPTPRSSTTPSEHKFFLNRHDFQNVSPRPPTGQDPVTINSNTQQKDILKGSFSAGNRLHARPSLSRPPNTMIPTQEHPAAQIPSSEAAKYLVTSTATLPPPATTTGHHRLELHVDSSSTKVSSFSKVFSSNKSLSAATTLSSVSLVTSKVPLLSVAKMKTATLASPVMSKVPVISATQVTPKALVKSKAQVTS
ncbi:MAGE-like protein 2-like 3, partial [Homarus americanus]